MIPKNSIPRQIYRQYFVNKIKIRVEGDILIIRSGSIHSFIESECDPLRLTELGEFNRKYAINRK